MNGKEGDFDVMFRQEGFKGPGLSRMLSIPSVP